MLSVVIPALNAEATLGACLDSIRDADEVIVVDGGSSDYTVDVAARRQARLLCAATGRGLQLIAGAEAAEGEWLLFLHSDTILLPGWRDAVDAHIAASPGKAACFRFRLDSQAWQARLIEGGVGMRVRLLGLPYGDQGLLISRAYYDGLGGYRALPLMEDVDLVRRIGKRRLNLLDADALTSAERWRRDGWFGRSARNLALLTLYGLGVSPRRLARLYR